MASLLDGLAEPFEVEAAEAALAGIDEADADRLLTELAAVLRNYG